MNPVAFVACLCAEWCAACREFRSTFEALQAEQPGVRLLWVDIEDEAELLGDVDVENFPTLLVVSEGRVRFLGAVEPHAAVVRELIARAIRGALLPVTDEKAAHLAARLLEAKRP
jgi:thioredoxin 1